MNISKKLELNLLYGYYKNLLTDKQKKIYELYYEEDYSINEIANMFEVTKNGIYNTIIKIEKLLIEYEEKLKCLQNYHENIKLLEDNEINDKIVKELK